MKSSGREPLDIRKYPNRRYYDATHSRHLTLEQIRDLVRDGCDLKVTDSKTGADITAQLLTQIILELEPPKLNGLPVNMLVQMIRANERVVSEFTRTYFDQAFSAYLAYQKQVQEQLRSAGIPAANPFASWAQAFAPAAAPEPAKPNPPRNAAPDDLRDVVAALREEIATLRGEVRAKGSPKKRRNTASAQK